MKKLQAILFLLFVSIVTLAQDKPAIDKWAEIGWPRLLSNEGNLALSRDGHYVAYIIHDQPLGQKKLVLQDLRGHWKKTIVRKNALILFFSSDNRQLCWQQGDSIWLQRTGIDENRLLGITKAISYPINKKGDWMALLSTKSDTAFRLINIVNGKERLLSLIKKHSWLTNYKLLISTFRGDLKALNLKDGKEQAFGEVKEYALSGDQQNIVLLTKKGIDSIPCLLLSRLNGSLPISIWKGHIGEQPGNYVFDKSGNQLVFTVRSPTGKLAIWYYKSGESAASLKADESDNILVKNLAISSLRVFSSNGRWLFFNVRKQLASLSNGSITAPVDIWSYRDEILNPAQSDNVESFREYAAVMEVSTKKVQLLEQHDDEKMEMIPPGNHLIIRKGGATVGAWWPYSEPYSIWILNLEEGRRRQVKIQSRSFRDGIPYSYSPGGRICFWDAVLGHYFTIDSQTGECINLTANIPFSLVSDIEQLIKPVPVGIAGWYSDDNVVLIYDNYDIWKLDLSGKTNPINITGGYGRKHGIKLRLVYGKNLAYNGNEELLLSGLDVKTQYNGFFRLRLRQPGNPELLTMGPYTYYQATVFKQSFNNPTQPLLGGEGKNKCWIVMRESAMEYPNFFLSKDLKNFRALTNLQPQKSYNWLNSEVVDWKMYNGQINHGVLYKPENFDPNKKYPIIFNYYEKFAQRCYQFPKPGLTTDNINIPWFVSRGYLVFTPDIQYSVASMPNGMTISEAAYNSVASAAEFLSRRSYINKSRMAVQGHSLGGHETNAIITQTGLFAAAAEVAGYSDNLSAYLTLVGVPNEKDHKIDHYNQRMGATPWERPDLFRRNSPVLNADKITTPLFIVHNKNDDSVNFRQGVEMYMAMRRLGKSCWLLQYDNSGHVLNDNDALDYTIRLTQYFDHYLKGEPAPLWMTMNTLAQYKGKNNLYELDPKGNCGKDCKVCKEWNAKQITETK